MTGTQTITALEYREMVGNKKRRQKYGNTRTVYRGEAFDSKKELARWKELEILQAVGEILCLQRQVKFVLVEKMPGQREISYIADAVYLVREGFGEYHPVVEDVKSPVTRRNPVYRMKKKLMWAKYRIRITEV